MVISSNFVAPSANAASPPGENLPRSATTTFSVGLIVEHAGGGRAVPPEVIDGRYEGYPHWGLND